jgi:hypothetical protein
MCHPALPWPPDDVWVSDLLGILSAMTEMRDEIEHDVATDDAAISDALRLIDKGLSDLLHRELVSTDEVSDLLLDVRTLLTAAGEVADTASVGA